MRRFEYSVFISLCGCRLSLTEQLRTVRGEAALRSEEVQRLKSELASEKFQRWVHVYKS